MQHGPYIEHIQGARRPDATANHAVAAKDGTGRRRTGPDSGPEPAAHFPPHQDIG